MVNKVLSMPSSVILAAIVFVVAMVFAALTSPLFLMSVTVVFAFMVSVIRLMIYVTVRV